MRYKAVIFDLDGTILDTLDDLTNACGHVLSMHGFPKRTSEEIRTFVGNGIRRTLKLSAPDGTPEEIIDCLYREYGVYYNEHCDICTRPYEGITELLCELKSKGIKLAVVSNKGEKAVHILCDKYFPGIFDAAAGEKPGIRRKPAPDSLNACMKDLSIDRSGAIYVGDSEVDIETAANAGLPCISVTWGFRDRSFLSAHGAKLYAGHPSEIQDLILTR